MIKWIVLATVATIVGSVQTLQASPPPTYDVPQITDTSTLIVVGRVIKIDRQGVPPHDTQSVVIDVKQVLKGNEKQPLPIKAELRRVDNLLGLVLYGQFSMFFLREGRNGLYTSVDPAYPAIVASPEFAKAMPPSEEAPVKVATELAWVLATPIERLSDPENGVRQSPMLIVNDADPGGVVAPPAPSHWVKPPYSWQGQNIYREASRALGSMKYETARYPLEEIVTSKQALTRMWAVYCLIGFGDASYLPKITSDLLDYNRDSAFTVLALSDRIRGLSPTPDSVPTFANLLRSRVVAIRRAAAEVLSRGSDKAVIGPLVLALYDTDEDVRFFAVSGLAKATKSRAQPTPSGFKDDEDVELRFWKNWAKNNND